MYSTNSLSSDIETLQWEVSHFLEQQYDPARPLLLALSGGPDSLALLHALLEYRKAKPLSFGIAHLDHGWRTESGEEARLLQQMARALGLPFHLKRLNLKERHGNLEAISREERLKFFGEICRSCGYQAVLLAHHADDQVETVLKRVLEGVSLPYLSSMRPVSIVYGIPIWRPLLALQKRQILAWLEQKGLKGFDDSTNLDPKFLRGRFRTRLLPLLAAEFGKEVGPSLERIATEAAELRQYLDEKVKADLSRLEKSPSGLFLDLSESCPSHPFELRYLIRKMCEEGDLSLSREALETSVQLVLSKAADKEVEMGINHLKFDRGRLFLPLRSWEEMDEVKLLQTGEVSIGQWHVEAVECEAPCDKKGLSGWKEAWKGRVEAWLPLENQGRYSIGKVKLNAPYQGRVSISKWWTNAKVPAFMRQAVPVIWNESCVYHEFLTGCENQNFVFVKKWLHVVLERKR